MGCDMGWRVWWATKRAKAMVQRGLTSASTDRLIRHYNRLERASRVAIGLGQRTEIVLLQEQILKEVKRRGAKTLGG